MGVIIGYLIGGVLGNLIVWVFRLALWLVKTAVKLVWYIGCGIINFIDGVAAAARDEERACAELRMKYEPMPGLSIPSRDEYMGSSNINRREKENHREKVSRKGREPNDFFRRLPEADRWD